MDQEQSQQIGPYQILSEIGRGGMGVVYRAQHGETGNLVALKTVNIPFEEQIANIRREIRSLARISVPGIINILDEGIHDGLPWYAMEIVEGVTLKEYCSGILSGADSDAFRLEDVDSTVQGSLPEIMSEILSEPLIEKRRRKETACDINLLLTVVARLCHSLAGLHGEGIVHRDLKPENILVQANGFPVLLDFGVATRFHGGVSREELEIGGLVVGTLVYMAPEQIRGEFVDARADLYSLGCIMYEMITDRLPCPGESTVQVVRSHLHHNPVAPSEIITGIPERLDQLILGLIKKEPRDRIGHALDVVEILANLGVDTGYPHGDAAPPKPYLYRSGFFGRDNVIDAISTHVVNLQFGHGGIFLLGGEAGVGKTRIVKELTRVAQNKNVIVVPGECRQIVGRTEDAEAFNEIPLYPFRQLLRTLTDHCRSHGLPETEKIFGKRGPLLSVFEPGIQNLPGQEKYPKPARLSLDMARLRLFSYLSRTLENYVWKQPVLFIIDDLHWADNMTVNYLQYLHREDILKEMNLMILGTFRTEEMFDSLKEFSQETDITVVTLDRLEPGDVRKMAEDMLASPMVPETLINFLVHHSEGNPFFVAEYLRSAVAGNLLIKGIEGKWRIADHVAADSQASIAEQITLPGSVAELIGQRLSTLDGYARKVADVASVLGRQINTDLIAGVGEIPEIYVYESIGELIARQVFEETETNRIHFIHDRIREVMYRQIDENLRRKYHAAAATILEARQGSREEIYYALLAEHWKRADRNDRAMEYYLKGARDSMSHYAYRRAERLFRSYFDISDEMDPITIANRIDFANEVLLVQGRSQEALVDFESALEAAIEIECLDLQGKSLLGLADGYRDLGRLDQALINVENALMVYRAIGDDKLEGRTLSRMALIHYEKGDLKRSREIMEQGYALHQSSGDREEEGITLGRLAMIYMGQGEFDRAVKFYEKGLDINRALGNQMAEAVALGNLGTAFQAEGDLEYAYRLLKRAHKIFHDIHEKRGEAMILTNIVSTMILDGKIEEANSIAKKVLDIHREFGERRWEAADMMNLAIIKRIREDYTGSEILLDAVLTMYRELGDRYQEAQALYNYGNLKSKTGDFSAATEMYREGIRLLRETGDRLKLPLLLLKLAQVHRDAETGDHLAEAASIFRDLGNMAMAGVCFCESGHLALVTGENADEYLIAADECLRSASRSSFLDRLNFYLDRLKRAVDAEEKGTGLVAGYIPEDLPSPFRHEL